MPAVPKRYVFVLLEDYSQVSFCNAVEALRMANEESPRPFYCWHVISESGVSARSSNGLETQVQGGLTDLDHSDTLVVCGGDHVRRNSTPGILSWLRRQERRVGRIGSLATGGFTLALAGFLNGKRVTLHWDYLSSFAEMFPEAEVLDTIYDIDGRFFSCAGGAASLDLMLKLIEGDYGPELSVKAADKLIYTSSRGRDFSQRLSVQARSGGRHEKCAKAIALMQSHIETPLSMTEIAESVGISSRQLERIFQRHMQATPKRVYLGMRLQKARDLLLQTDMRVTEIGLACGFSSHTHFAKCYRRAFGNAPSRDAAGG